MASHEERLAVLETTVNEHSLTFVQIRDSMLHMEQRMDVRFDRLDDKFTRLEEKVSRVFMWVVGIQITVLLAVIGSLLGLVAILAPR